jgi:hypothetical protein
LKREKHKEFVLCNLDLSLNEILKGEEVIEYPIVHIWLKGHEDENVKLVDKDASSSSESSSEDSSSDDSSDDSDSDNEAVKQDIDSQKENEAEHIDSQKETEAQADSNDN